MNLKSTALGISIAFNIILKYALCTAYHKRCIQEP